MSEPPLEQTSTGRKIRIAGTTESLYHNELETLLDKAVKGIAEQKSTRVLICLTELRDKEKRALGFDPYTEKAALHVVHKTDERYAATNLWWRFKHSTMPYEVMLIVKLSNGYGANVMNQTLRIGVLMPVPAYGGYANTDFVAVYNESWSDVIDRVNNVGGDFYAWREFIRDQPKQSWVSFLTDGKALPHQRAGVEALLNVVREFDKHGTIAVPDLRNPDAPGWMDLDLYETNVNSRLVSDLTEYLDGAPTVEKAAELYDQMLQALRATGIVVKAKKGNEFMAALLNGEKVSMNMQIEQLAEEDGRIDHEHTLSVHLPTGTFVVECSKNVASPDEVADKWEEALTMAALTGQESELLAFAKGHAAEFNKARTRKILKDRQVV